MKKIALFLVLSVLALGYLQQRGIPLPGIASFSSDAAEGKLLAAYRNKQSHLQVHGRGTVVTVLPDDLVGSRHQKFILKMDTGQTLLIAHNIDLAPRIRNLKPGDVVQFFGEYEWNSKGGVIHWTHHDPGNLHVGGWLKRQGNTYQ